MPQRKWVLAATFRDFRAWQAQFPWVAGIWVHDYQGLMGLQWENLIVLPGWDRALAPDKGRTSELEHMAARLSMLRRMHKRCKHRGAPAKAKKV